jgi:hypothetical protein
MIFFLNKQDQRQDLEMKLSEFGEGKIYFYLCRLLYPTSAALPGGLR